MNYDTDDPNKEKLTWSNLDNWLIDTTACGTAVIWVKDKIADLQKVKKDTESTGTYNMDSSIYALEQFIIAGGNQLQWADWFIVQIFDEKEYKDYAKFALDQIPKDADKNNELLADAILQAKSCYKNTTDNNKPSAARKTVEYVIRVFALHDPTMNTDDVLVKILNYGINLLKQRKL